MKNSTGQPRKPAQVIIISNNRRLENPGENLALRPKAKIFLRDCEIQNVLTEAEELIKTGHSMLADPLPPNYTLFSSPVRSLVFAGEKIELEQEQTEMMMRKLEAYRYRLERQKLDFERRAEYEKLDLWQLSNILQEIYRGGSYSAVKAEQNQN